jgi:hypothetical protein
VRASGINAFHPVQDGVKAVDCVLAYDAQHAAQVEAAGGPRGMPLGGNAGDVFN